MYWQSHFFSQHGQGAYGIPLVAGHSSSSKQFIFCSKVKCKRCSELGKRIGQCIFITLFLLKKKKLFRVQIWFETIWMLSLLLMIISWTGYFLVNGSMEDKQFFTLMHVLPKSIKHACVESQDDICGGVLVWQSLLYFMSQGNDPVICTEKTRISTNIKYTCISDKDMYTCIFNE